MLEKTTLEGESIENLSASSGKKIRRTCDFCAKVQILRYVDIQKQRRNYARLHEQIKDRCHDCQIRQMTKNRFRPIKKTKLTQGNYIRVVDPLTGISKAEHRIIVEDNIKRKLTDEEVVHHINGIKKDNRIENLALLPNERIHIQLHRNLEKLVLSLIEKNIIYFDRSTNNYHLVEG